MYVKTDKMSSWSGLLQVHVYFLSNQTAEGIQKLFYQKEIAIQPP